MRLHLAFCALLLTTVAVACGSEDGGAPRDSGILDHGDIGGGDSLVGAWQTAPIAFSEGDGSGTYTQAWTFHSTMKLEVTQVATYTSGGQVAGCVTTTTGRGRYTKTSSVLDLTLDDYATETKGCADRNQNDVVTRVSESYDAEPYPPGGGNEFHYDITNNTLSLTVTYGTEQGSPIVYHRL